MAATTIHSLNICQKLVLFKYVNCQTPCKQYAFFLLLIFVSITSSSAKSLTSKSNRPTPEKSAEMAKLISVNDFGAKGDGATNDSAAFNTSLLAAKTQGIGIVLAPRPKDSYLLNTPVVEQDGVSLWYNPQDIKGSYRPEKGNQLGAIEGVPQDQYKHAFSAFLQVPRSNPKPFRYWALYGAVDVPPGANIPAGDVRHDHLGTRGQARSRSVNARIWGVVGAAVADQTAVNDTEMGSVYGGEFDVNNNTTRSIVEMTGPEIVGAQIATGGRNVALAGVNVSRGGNAQFLSGINFKNGSIKSYGIHFADVGPDAAAIYVSDSYSSSAPIMSVKYGIDAIHLRNATSTDHEGRILASTNKMVFVNGSTGQLWANHSNDAVLGRLNETGAWSFKKYGSMLNIINTPGILTNLNISGGGITQLTAATQINNLTAGEIIGQELTLYLTRSGGMTLVHGNSNGGSPMILTNSVNAVLNRFSTVTLFWDGLSWIEKARSAK